MTNETEPRKETPRRRRPASERTVPLHVMVLPRHRRYFERLARRQRITLGAAVRSEVTRWIAHFPRA